MDIIAGDRVIVQISTFEDRFMGLVVKVRPGRSISLHLSVPPRVVERLETGTPVLVRYAFDGRLMGFDSKVVHWLAEDDLLMDITPPKKVFEAEERCEPRCACSFPAILVEGEKATRGVVEDMSASCARIRYLHHPPEDFPQEPGHTVRLTFHPFDMNGDGYSIGCCVLKEFMRNNEHYVVLRFNEDEVDVRQRIAGFIEAQVCCVLPRVEA